MPEKRTTAELIEIQEAKIEVELKRLEELRARLKTEHPDEAKLHNEMLNEFGSIIENHLGRELTEADKFRLTKFLEYQDERGSYFSDWMNKPLNIDKQKGNKKNDDNQM